MDTREANRFDLSFRSRYGAEGPGLRSRSPAWRLTARTPSPQPRQSRHEALEVQPLENERTWGADKRFLLSEEKTVNHEEGEAGDTRVPATYENAKARRVGPRRESTARFLMFGVLRWFGTATLSGLYYLAIRLHQDRTLSRGQKSAFDAIVVGLSIALGLNIAASLREMAIYMRWWFLGKRQIHIREIEVHSLIALVGLLWRSPAPSLKIVCLVWILLNIAIQTGISALSLTFQADPGIEDIYLDPSMGTIAIPDMSEFARIGRFNGGAGPQLLAAHILGDIGSSYNISTLPSTPMEDEPVARHPASVWDAGSHWEYIFLNSAPAHQSQDFNYLSVYSNQSVRSSGVCTTPPYDFTINKTAGAVSIRQTDSNTTAIFPSIALGVESIYYLTTPALIGRSGTTGSCGPGCSTIHALEPMAGPPAEGSYFNPESTFFYYSCNITVSTSSPSAGPFNFSATNAAVAAQAIALSEQTAPTTNGSLSTDVYTSYSFGLQYGEAQNNSATGMASMMSRFAIGAVAATAHTNPKRMVPGRQPRQGVRLVLEEPVAFVAVLAVAAGLQLGLLLVAAALVRAVTVEERVEGDWLQVGGSGVQAGREMEG
ncbi:hypothetical protein B0T16DRAFT_256 [Cercophora newfieldiana]|uniref:Uncharacterized protein n=1 Tax=Cercophora newfieldiana TaxID=92897 RepID=A0AA39YMR3_9PEZI|nr:hypothetical protein B0T16DRAFT_256 [Cercophora newfieldiana]